SGRRATPEQLLGQPRHRDLILFADSCGVQTKAQICASTLATGHRMKAHATSQRPLSTRPRAIALAIHLSLSCAAGATLLQATVAQAAGPAQRYAIPGGTLGDVLAQFAAQAGVKLS